MFEKEKFAVVELFDHIKEYFKARLDLFYLKLSDRLARILSGILSTVLIIFFFLFFLLFMSIASAKYLGNLLNSDALGYFAVALIYFVFLLIIISFKNGLIKEPLANRIMESFNREGDKTE